jgi:ferrochelatase
MTYGSPSIASALRSLRDRGVDRMIILPLYPQFSTTTTLPVFDRVERELKTWSAQPAIARIDHYHAEPAYLDALAQSVRDGWAVHGRKHLFFSYHGIPKRYVDKGDPYFDHCVATTRGVTERLQLKDNEWTLAFQSRVGGGEWLSPYTDRTLLEYAKSGPKDLSVICPAFATDCLETLEEIAMRNREDFLHAGGASLDYIPCLNSQSAHVSMFAWLIERT